MKASSRTNRGDKGSLEVRESENVDKAREERKICASERERNGKLTKIFYFGKAHSSFHGK
jgi:hypothetical protein